MNGLGVYDQLIRDIYDPEMSILYPAISCINNDEMAARCKVKNAPKVIYSVKATDKFNSECALLLRESFKQGKIRLLINGLAGCGLSASQTSNDDLRIVLDNFLNGGKTTEFGTVVPR